MRTLAVVPLQPMVHESNENPFVLDSGRPKIPLKNYAYNEVRYKVLAHPTPRKPRISWIRPSRINRRWSVYEDMAARSGDTFQPKYKP